MGDAHHGALQDTWNGIDLGLDLLGIDVEASRYDQVLAAADNVDVAHVIDLSEIARDEETVGPKLRSRLLGHAPIALEDVGAANLDHADLVRRQHSLRLRI